MNYTGSSSHVLSAMFNFWSNINFFWKKKNCIKFSLAYHLNEVCTCSSHRNSTLSETSTRDKCNQPIRAYFIFLNFPLSICIKGTKLPKLSFILCATYAHMRGSRCLVCVLMCVHVCECELCSLQLAHCCMLLYTEALGQTPSALITAAINQTSTDSCVIPL